ncbi:MAG TPA: flagellum-specific ATP synthase FliI, partial [Caulobacteraceae bacterium]|nr:flagellum-specific ATP synthase FliI [Caulobacteraceae bacterium]
CQKPFEREIAAGARAALASFSNMEELIRIGAYRLGSDAQVDRAIQLNPALEQFLGQDKDDTTPLDQSFMRLEAILRDVA